MRLVTFQQPGSAPEAGIVEAESEFTAWVWT